jgi:hypothetical protein
MTKYVVMFQVELGEFMYASMRTPSPTTVRQLSLMTRLRLSNTQRHGTLV